MPQVKGILETALHVENIQRSVDFYQRLFGFKPMLETDRLTALSVTDKQVLLIFSKHASSDPVEIPGGIIPPHGAQGQTHFAFSIATEDLDAWREHLAAHNVAIESTVQWEEGGTSIYFRDPDQHLAELITPGCWPIY